MTDRTPSRRRPLARRHARARGARRRGSLGALAAVLAVGAGLLLVACADDDAGTGGAVDTVAPDASPLAVRGRQVFAARGCPACHEATTTPLGPALRGLAGSTVTLTDGTAVVVDADYLRRAITDPTSQVVQGWGSGTMPTYDLSADQLDALVAYLQSI